MLANISDMLLDQKSSIQQEAGFPGGDKQTDNRQQTDIATFRLNHSRGRCSDNIGLQQTLLITGTVIMKNPSTTLSIQQKLNPLTNYI